MLKTDFICGAISWLAANIALNAGASAPAIDRPPRGQEVTFHRPAAFGVIASGNAPLSYQWLKNGVPVAGATNDQILFPQAQFSDEGSYSVAVSNPDGTANSASADLVVKLPRPGDVDGSFVNGGVINRTVLCLAAQPDGKLLMGGEFSSIQGAARGRIARLNTDGSTDYTFMNGLTGADRTVYAIAIQSDGKVWQDPH